LEWLDWTATVDMTATMATNNFADYRLATHEELRGLLNSVFGGSLRFNSFNSACFRGCVAYRTPEGVNFTALFGANPNGLRNPHYVSIEGTGLYGFDHTILGGYSPDIYGAIGYRHNSHGIAMVAKEVPEPSTLAIFVLGMIGLASRRFKKQ
jgi:hypothetical protein